MKELSTEIKDQMERLVEKIADQFLPGRPAILAPAIYFKIEKCIKEQIEEIEEKFPI